MLCYIFLQTLNHFFVFIKRRVLSLKNRAVILGLKKNKQPINRLAISKILPWYGDNLLGA